MNDIANRILEAHDTTGSNCEYRLAAAIRKPFPQHHDEHLFDLEKFAEGIHKLLETIISYFLRKSKKRG